MEKIGKITDIQRNECKLIELNGKKIAIYNAEGKIYATDAECTHMRAPLYKGSILQGKYIRCPWHGAIFDLETGKVMSGPAKVGIKTYKVKIENDEIFLEI